MSELPRTNPYTPGAGTRPSVLAGRATQIALIQSLADQVEAGKQANPIIFTGLRGMGKTSLLYQARDLLRARGWLAGYYEVRRDVEPGTAIQTIVADSAQLSTGGLRRALATGAHSIGNFRLALGPTGFSFAVATKISDAAVDPFPELVAFLSRLGTDARANGVGVALLIDELQIFLKRDLALLVQALSALKEQPIVLIGAGLPYLASEMAKANTYAERFRYEEIASLNDGDAREAVESPAFNQGFFWDQDAVADLVAESSGYPYFLQLYASEAWVAAAAADAPTITAEHVRLAGNPVRKQLDAGLYAARYDRLSDREREYVDAMVQVLVSEREGGTIGVNAARVSSGKVAGLLGKPLNVVGPIRDRVIKKGIIYAPQYGVLEFSVPGFADYVARRSASGDI
ncbi:MAG: ATP-binding protein [Microbacteriaceae bacterium]|nr:ATP-binding protein [Microbacteriaceae bacterium]